MATGNSLVQFEAPDNHPPLTAYATLDMRNGHPVLDFDASVAESAHFEGVLPRHYAGGGLSIRLAWMASSATSGAVAWGAVVERHDAATDLDADSFAAGTVGASNAPGTSGFPQYVDMVLSNSQIDGLVAGEHFRLKITRDGTAGSDTMAGDAELLSVEIRET